ncbi:DUF1269 domain-containing protein [Nocardioides endophyticus]|uniref:DUF1269 domain-containing protein n=1 Tax=Nocardioides endophyticus TaxID=1353775 RepID=A0ABP8Z5Z5_9ACTN
MGTLAVWQLGSVDAASRSADLLGRLVRDDLLVIHDAAVVEWARDDRRPSTRPLNDAAPTGAPTDGALTDGALTDGVLTDGVLGSGFWGLLFGLVFFVPLLGAAIGATTGALAGALADVGIDDHFINRVRDQVTPGTSALFLLAPDSVVGRVHDELAELRPTLITTHLDDDQEAALRAVFGG